MKLEEIVSAVDSMYDFLVKTRRHLHMHPELSEREFETQKFVTDFLDLHSIPYRKTADTGVVAWIRGALDGGTVAVRGDMDALPITEESTQPYVSQNTGIMHACGHDAHTTVVMGLAKFFRDNADKFGGTVKFLFQPAEETVGGAKRMIADRCLEDPQVDYIVGLHVMPGHDYNTVELKRGTLNVSSNEVTLTVRGKTCHGAYPHRGVDAIVAAAQIVSALQTVVSRNVPPVDSAVITLGQINGGTKGNIIADCVVLKGTIRASNSELRAMLLEKVRTVSENTARAMGAGCDVFIDTEGYPALVNHDEVIDVMAENAIKYLGAENVNQTPATSMGAEDFSFFTEAVPGAFFNLGCRVQEMDSYSLHTKDFDIDERCLKTGVVLQVMNILTLLQKGR